MNYWMTTHWPPREDEGNNTTCGVWLPEGREEAGKEVVEGDFVFVYESRTGRTAVRRTIEGAEQRVKCLTGREGLILIGRAMSSFHIEPDSKPEIYVDGTSIWWRWYVPLVVLSRSGFVPRKEVNRVLGYKSTFNFRGFGEVHSGLKKITKTEYDELIVLFRNYNPLTLPVYSLRRTRGKISKGGSGIESKDHLDLKEYIANNPSLILGEGGLNTIGVEYKFQTGDQADIVLSDHVGRIIGVEVEVEVDKDQLDGPLQAIKYRYMLELVTKRAPGDSRAILVAYRIHTSVSKCCKEYNVECREIPRDMVIAWRKKKDKE